MNKRRSRPYEELQVPQEKIDKALELANASRFLANLPDGINTEVLPTVFNEKLNYPIQVGEKGTQMSGGQKQVCQVSFPAQNGGVEKRMK